MLDTGCNQTSGMTKDLPLLKELHDVHGSQCLAIESSRDGHPALILIRVFKQDVSSERWRDP